MKCNYPLRGLPEPRCPECARKFDPDDLTTVNLGCPMSPTARALMKPVGVGSRRAFILICVLILWSRAWLPFGLWVLAAAVVLWVALTIYVVIRASVAFIVRVTHRQPRIRPDPGRIGRLEWVLTVLVISSIAFNWPLYLHVWVNLPWLNPFARYVYEERPLLDTSPPPSHVGTIWLRGMIVSPRGLRLEVNGGLFLLYDPDPNERRWWDQQPLPGGWRVDNRY